MKTSKFLCALLALVMMLSLCACGSASSASGTQTVTAGPSTTGSVSPAEPETAEEPEAPADTADEGFSVGGTVNNTYENEFFGIGVTLDENWTFASQEEIDESNGTVKDVLDNEDYSAAMDDGRVITDMMASADDGILSMNVTIEKLNAVASLAIDEEAYIDLTLENNDFSAIFTGMGFDSAEASKGSVVLAGEEHPCAVIEGSIQGIGFYEKVAVIKVGSYVLSVTVSSLMDDVVDDLFACFYAL